MISEDFKMGWIVAIIEGEGWIGSDKGGRPKVQVTMTDKDVIYQLLEWSGVGTVSEAKHKTISGKRIWVWAIYARDEAGKFIEQILPFLCDRRLLRAIEVLSKWKDLEPKRGTASTCAHGHSLEGYNLILREGRRRCRTCINTRARAYRNGMVAEDIDW